MQFLDVIRICHSNIVIKTENNTNISYRAVNNLKRYVKWSLLQTRRTKRRSCGLGETKEVEGKRRNLNCRLYSRHTGWNITLLCDVDYLRWRGTLLGE